MKKDAQWGDRKSKLGIGLLNWPNHVRALRIHWVTQRYLDGRRGPWKELLDLWLARTPMGRGGVLDTTPAAQLYKSTTANGTPVSPPAILETGSQGREGPGHYQAPPPEMGAR